MKIKDRFNKAIDSIRLWFDKQQVIIVDTKFIETDNYSILMICLIIILIYFTIV